MLGELESGIYEFVNKKSRAFYDEHVFYQKLTEFLHKNNLLPYEERITQNTVTGYKKGIDWYLIYRDLKEKTLEEKNAGKRYVEGTVPYPWKSKARTFLRNNPDIPYEIRPYEKYVTKKALKQVYKPTFSKFFGTWEIDYVFNLTSIYNREYTNQSPHLFCINVNTRYLFVVRMQNKSDIIDAMTKIFVKCSELNKKYHTKRFVIKNLKGDGERAFLSRGFFNFLSTRNNFTRDNLYFVSSPFTNHNRIVDAVIKTIRDAIGYRRITEDQLQQIVDYYNNTVHRTIGCTPMEMMLNEEWEAQYIRWCYEKLREINEKQPLRYEKGNILLLHCDMSKTPNSFEKRRMFWDRVGEFIRYDHGNVVVKVISPESSPAKLFNRNKNIVLPPHYTQYIGENISSVPESFKRLHNL
jgi:hypothetical protein